MFLGRERLRIVVTRSGFVHVRSAVLEFSSAVARCLSRLPERGTSGSVQRGPANPARPGREQRYRERLGCRRSPEVPRTEHFFSNQLPVVGRNCTLSTYGLSSHRTEIPPTNISGSCRTRARNRNAGERDKKQSCGACVHFFRSAWRRENHRGENSCESAELRKRSDSRALRSVRFVQRDCRGEFARRD